ncbi:hypothetical protein I6F15_03515 [Bradyrhizobium sp. BRP14]|nr:hypothetical protein [Bradyrhizobium sp. BRP14]
MPDLCTYCISFRIAEKTVDGKTYEERRQSVMEAVRGTNGFWDSTTSFVLTESTLDTNALAKKASAALSAKDDQLIVFDPGDMSVAHFGPVSAPDVLTSFFRYAKAV